MLQSYVIAAIAKASYKQLGTGEWFAEIDGFQGVWANGASVEECRNELIEVLEEWLVLKIRDGDDLPVVDGHEIKISASA